VSGNVRGAILQWESARFFGWKWGAYRVGNSKFPTIVRKFAVVGNCPSGNTRQSGNGAGKESNFSNGNSVVPLEIILIMIK